MYLILPVMKSFHWVRSSGYEPKMQGNTIADNKKMLEDLWIPQISFDEGLSRILAERAGDKDE